MKIKCVSLYFAIICFVNMLTTTSFAIYGIAWTNNNKLVFRSAKAYEEITSMPFKTVALIVMLPLSPFLRGYAHSNNPHPSKSFFSGWLDKEVVWNWFEYDPVQQTTNQVSQNYAAKSLKTKPIKTFPAKIEDNNIIIIDNNGHIRHRVKLSPYTPVSIEDLCDSSILLIKAEQRLPPIYKPSYKSTTKYALFAVSLQTGQATKILDERLSKRVAWFHSKKIIFSTYSPIATYMYDFEKGGGKDNFIWLKNVYDHWVMPTNQRGKIIYVDSLNGSLYQRDLNNPKNQPKLLYKKKSNIYNLLFSPSENYLLFFDGSELIIYNLITEKIIPIGYFSNNRYKLFGLKIL